MGLKMNYLKILLIAIITLTSLAAYSFSCTAPNGSWTNCTIETSASGLTQITNSVLDNFPYTQINSTTGLPVQNYTGYFILWVAIYISIAIFMEVGAHLMGNRNEWAIFNYITFLGLVVALVMRVYGTLGPTAIDIAVSLVAISILASLFFGR